MKIKKFNVDTILFSKPMCIQIFSIIQIMFFMGFFLFVGLHIAYLVVISLVS